MTSSDFGVSLPEAGADFDRMAKRAFERQVQASPVYGRFAAGHVWTDWRSAPYLPVEAFKWRDVVGAASTETTFQSSGTGGAPSWHAVVDLSLYEQSIVEHFRDVFGGGPFTFLAHLPTYHQQDSASSLLYMVSVLIRTFGSPASASVLDPATFNLRLRQAAGERHPLLIFGTAFGLLDMIDRDRYRLPEASRVIETGGMKTHRREISRTELHERLATGFGIARDRITSEYGMCELLSQCYTHGAEVFYPPAWMRFQVMDVDRPDRRAAMGRPGLLAVFDLANLHSVSAILTSDLAIEHSGGFELLGRAHAAEIRGCNFLLSTNP